MDRVSTALANWGLADADHERFGTGLINETYRVTAADKTQYILQGLNAAFEPQVNRDIDALTRHLEQAGYATQRLVTTRSSKLWAEEGGRVWRLSTFVPGQCFTMLETEQQAREAGRLLARFHAGISNLDIELHTQRLGVHDTARHLQTLRSTLESHTQHPYFARVKPLAERILAEAETLPELPVLPDRLVHGDPKISNLVFDETTGAGICMIDLDTLTHMPLPLEMGDAFRSWCNPRGEDRQKSEFSMRLFAAAVQGYAELGADFVTEQEWQAFLPATRTIMVELASRFATDALRDCYFGWNAEVFPDRSSHNLVRAAGQLELEKSLVARLPEAERIVAAAFKV